MKNSAQASKINWTSAIGAVAAIGALFGVEIDAEQQATLVTAIAVATSALNMIWRTWFN